MAWYDIDIASHDVKTLQLVRIGEVRKFETRSEYSSDIYSASSNVPYSTFKFKLEKVKVIKRPENLKVEDESLLNIVQGINPPNIDNFETVGVLSNMSPSGYSFKDKIVRKLRFDKSADSFYKVLGTYYII